MWNRGTHRPGGGRRVSHAVARKRERRYANASDEEHRKMVEQQKDDGFDRVLEAHMDMETERAPGNTGKNGR